VLISTFDDNSYVRQRLAMTSGTGSIRHIQIKTYSAVVFVDGSTWGSTRSRSHRRLLMEDHGYSQDGNLYKAVNHDASFALTSIQNGGAPKATLHDGYVKKEGLPLEGQPGAFADLEDLVSFIATSDPQTFRDQIGARIDRRDYEDWWIFVTLIMADDSAGKNSYHYHDPVAGGPFRYAPWDFNASFGQTWQTEREPASMYTDYVGMNLLFQRLLEDPSFGDPLRARYGEVLHGALDIAAVQALVDTGRAHRRERAPRRGEVGRRVPVV
jgi:spore coat protein CotH